MAIYPDITMFFGEFPIESSGRVADAAPAKQAEGTPAPLDPRSVFADAAAEAARTFLRELGAVPQGSINTRHFAQAVIIGLHAGLSDANPDHARQYYVRLNLTNPRLGIVDYATRLRGLAEIYVRITNPEGKAAISEALRPLYDQRTEDGQRGAASAEHALITNAYYSAMASPRNEADPSYQDRFDAIDEQVYMINRFRKSRADTDALKRLVYDSLRAAGRGGIAYPNLIEDYLTHILSSKLSPRDCQTVLTDLFRRSGNIKINDFILRLVDRLAYLPPRTFIFTDNLVIKDMFRVAHELSDTYLRPNPTYIYNAQGQIDGVFMSPDSGGLSKRFRFRTEPMVIEHELCVRLNIGYLESDYRFPRLQNIIAAIEAKHPASATWTTRMREAISQFDHTDSTMDRVALEIGRTLLSEAEGGRPDFDKAMQRIAGLGADLRDNYDRLMGSPVLRREAAPGETGGLMSPEDPLRVRGAGEGRRPLERGRK